MTRGAAALALLWLLAGCVERQVTIDSDPQGADLYVNGDYKGQTPAKFEFSHYGKWDVSLRKPGCRTREIAQNVSAPLYEWPPFDMLSGAFVPWVARVKPSFRYEMEKARLSSKEEALGRAELMREEIYKARGYPELPPLKSGAIAPDAEEIRGAPSP